MKESKQAGERRQFLMQIQERPLDAKLHIELARSLRPGGAYIGWSTKQKKEALKAEAEYKRAIELQPDSLQTHLELGMLYVAMKWQIPKQTDAFTKAESELSEAIKIDFVDL